MQAPPNLKIVHESETQRQHARLPIPATVTINGKRYGVKDLSAGGIAIANSASNLKSGQMIEMRLALPLNGFSLDIDLESEIRHSDAEKNTTGGRFANQSPENIALLNYILKSYAAGDMATPQDLINISRRNNFVDKPRQRQEMSEAELSRQIFGLSVVALVGFLILFFIAGNLYNNLFLIKSQDASVMGPSFEIKATMDGVYHPRLDPGSATVRKNQTIGLVKSVNGDRQTSIVSPCNCYVVKQNGVENEYVSADTSVLTLIPADAKLWVTADLDSAHATKMGTDTPAVIRVFGSKAQYNGHINNVEASPPNAGDRRVIVNIIPDQALPVDLVGRPAVVSFKLLELPKLSRGGK